MLRKAALLFLLSACPQIMAEEDQKTVYQKVARNTFWVHKNGGTGSAFLIDREKRLAITNQHMVDFQNSVTVVCPIVGKDGKVITVRGAYQSAQRLTAEVIDIDYDRDLALIRILEQLPDFMDGLPLAASYPDPGELILSVGNPGVSEGNFVLSMGNVRDRVTMRLPNKRGQKLRKPVNAIEMQNPINPGDSGGPTVNMKGQVVGITQGQTIPNAGLLMTYLVPSMEAKAFLVGAAKWLNPKTPSELLARAQHRNQIGMCESEFSDLTNLIKVSPKNTQLFYLRGLCAFKLKKYLIAIDDQSKVIADNPKMEAAYSVRADSYLAKGELEKAISDVHEAIELSPKNGEYLVLRAQIFKALGRNSEARMDFDKAIEVGKTNFLFHYNKGRYLLETGAYQDGESALTEAIRLNGEHPDSYLDRARCRLQLGQGQDGLNDIENVLRLAPGDPNALGCKALVLFQLGQVDSARELSAVVLAQIPNVPEALLTKAKIQLKEKQFDQTLQILDKLVKIDLVKPEALIARAYTLRQLGRPDQALEDYRSLGKIHDFSAQSSNLQGTVFHQKKEYAAAARAFTQAVEKDPNMYFAFYNRSLSYFELGEYQKAMDDVKKSLDLNPEFLEAQESLKKIAEKTGQK